MKCPLIFYTLRGAGENGDCVFVKEHKNRVCCHPSNKIHLCEYDVPIDLLTSDKKVVTVERNNNGR